MVKVWKMKEYNNNQRCVLSAEQVAAKKGGGGGKGDYTTRQAWKKAGAKDYGLSN